MWNGRSEFLPLSFILFNSSLPCKTEVSRILLKFLKMAPCINARAKSVIDKQVYLLFILSFSKEIDLSVWKVT